MDFLSNVNFISSLILILIILLLMMFIITKNILNIIPIMSAISFLACIFYLLLLAPDVAITEVSIGVVLGSALPFMLVTSCKFRDEKKFNNFIWMAILIIILFSMWKFMLLFPAFGTISDYSLSNVADYYIENTEFDIGINSIGTAILADYRGFDTFGETLVVFIVALGMKLLNDQKQIKLEKDDDQYQKTLSNLMCPIIFMYAIYIFINGEHTPGGGFQFGAIIASFLMLQMLSTNNLSKIFNEKNLLLSGIFGMVIYIIIGGIGIFHGDNYLDFASLNNNEQVAEQVGIWIVEFSIGITIASSLSYLVLNLYKSLVHVKY